MKYILSFHFNVMKSRNDWWVLPFMNQFIAKRIGSRSMINNCSFKQSQTYSLFWGCNLKVKNDVSKIDDDCYWCTDSFQSWEWRSHIEIQYIVILKWRYKGNISIQINLKSEKWKKIIEVKMLYRRIHIKVTLFTCFLLLYFRAHL